MVDEKLAHLDEAHSEKIKGLFLEYTDVIANSFDDVRPSKVMIRHKFELTTDEPIFQQVRRMPPAYNEIVRKEVDRMLAAGIITPVESSWTSPIVIVTKKDGNPRFCVDFRKLNAVMKRDRWPMPRVDEIFDEIKGSTVFTTIDLFQGYWQIKMDESCKEKTTFVCRYGTYQFEVMPFGLMNAGATFQRMMDQMLVNVSNVKCYIDDVVIHSATKEEHVGHLEKVLKLLRDKGLRLRLKKCHFMQPRVELLGHYVDKDGVHTDDVKVERIKNALPPRTRKELRSFLGLASYYRRFIRGFARIALPLTEKTSNNVDFTWTEEMQKSFGTLKEALCTAPVLVYPDYDKPFIVSTDASSRAVGAVLSQLDDEKREHPIHYASRTLNDAEKNYSAYEREALGIIFALKKFRHYLLCQKFTLYTDHQALKYVINMRDPHGRIARWMSLFSEFDFEIVYRSGEKNSNADFLSRPVEESIAMIMSTDLEEDLQAVVRYLTKGKVDGTSPSVRRAVKVRAKNYLMYEEELFRRTARGLRYVPSVEDRHSIMTALHDDIGHWGFAATYQMISDRFWWPKMRPDISHFVKSCDACQRTNPPEQSSPFGKIPVSGLFHTWSIDFAGPLPRTQSDNRYLLIAVEHLSGWPVARALPESHFNSLGVMTFVDEEIVAPFGSPKCMVSDNDMKFNSHLVRGYAKSVGIQWRFVSAYNPRGNAKAERMVGTLKKSVRKMMVSSEVEWDAWINRILGGYRKRPGADGKSPFEILFGVKPRFTHEPPVDEPVAWGVGMVRDVEVASVKARRAERVVPAASAPAAPFKVGDFVLMRRGKAVGPKLLRKDWSGPYQVEEEGHPTYILRRQGKRSRVPVHVRRLRKYVQRGYGPEYGSSCWFRYHTEDPCGRR